jgi:malate dehydrogenase (oxaloacetate-decarboxylating)(NADP+)
MESGVAQKSVDIEEYREQLEARLGRSREVMRFVIRRAKRLQKRIALPEGERDKILRASTIIIEEGIAQPILIGDPDKIRGRMLELGLELPGAEIINPADSDYLDEYAQEYWRLRRRKGCTLERARELIRVPRFFATMMVRKGHADTILGGVTMNYADMISPAIRILGCDEQIGIVAGMYMLIFPDRVVFFADATVNIDPTAEELAKIAEMTAQYVDGIGYEPRVAMLSFSNFGSTKHERSLKVKKATELVKQACPALVVDGEMQADTAVVPEILQKRYPFSSLKDGANVLIFPDLESANIAYKLCERLGGATAIGPILMGLNHSAHVLARGCDVDTIVHMAAIAVAEIEVTNRVCHVTTGE